MDILKSLLFISVMLFVVIISTSCTNANFVSEESKMSDLKYDYSGYFVQTETECFFVAEIETEMFYENEIVRIHPADDTVSFENLKTGDKIGVEIVTVGDLSIRVMPIYSVILLENGNISNVNESAITKIEQLGNKIT